jgi:hypothetical protein
MGNPGKAQHYYREFVDKRNAPHLEAQIKMMHAALDSGAHDVALDTLILLSGYLKIVLESSGRQPAVFASSFKTGKEERNYAKSVEGSFAKLLAKISVGNRHKDVLEHTAAAMRFSDSQNPADYESLFVRAAGLDLAGETELATLAYRHAIEDFPKNPHKVLEATRSYARAVTVKGGRVASENRAVHEVNFGCCVTDPYLFNPYGP